MNDKQFEISQIEAEIRWIENKMEEVKKEMVRRPSKNRHLNDLIRQKNERLEKRENLIIFNYD
jgi:peptidoglycan hydrolase CwlO-like protein